MSDELDAWRRRRALALAALKNSAPTGGGGAPAVCPAKPPDAPAGARAAAPDRGAAPPPVVIPLLGTQRARTVSQKQMKYERRREERLNGEQPSTPVVADRPKTRGDCAGGDRPCPLVGCRHHAAVDVDERTGSLKVNHPDKPVEELGASCSLDVTDQGGITLEQAGAVLNITRERARQIEEVALQKVAVALEPKFRGSCRARCAETGMTCKLPAHGPEVQHRNERGPFRAVALPGQTSFAEKRRVEEAARRNPTEALEASHV